MSSRWSRPVPVGNYAVIEDYEWPPLSVRILRLMGGAPIEPHVHRRSMQVYVALEGVSAITVDGVEVPLQPFAALAVWPGSVHSAASAGDSILMNISVPPLGKDDQLPAETGPDAPDLIMPGSASDIED